MAKIRIFGELLQGSHKTGYCQTSTGIILQLGLHVHQVLSNAKEVTCKPFAELIWR